MPLLSVSVNFFFLLTPFFVLSLFLDVCKNRTKKEKHRIAIKTSLYIYGICILILFFGKFIFSTLGITVLAFQIGSGIVLLLSGIAMIVTSNHIKTRNIEINDDDPCLIPLTLPITVGPGTTGALMVIGNTSDLTIKVYNSIGLFFAIFVIFLLLYFSDFIQKIIKDKGLVILSKLTGLFLTVLASQSILNGIETFILKFK